MLNFQNNILNFQVDILKIQDIKLNFQDSILSIQDTKSNFQVNMLNFYDTCSISKIQDKKMDKMELSGSRTQQILINCHVQIYLFI